MAQYVIGPLAAEHDRRSFDCGVPPLNQYLSRHAGQDVRRYVASCFVATDSGTPTIAGYYTLSAGSILLPDLPQPIVKKLPRYPDVPVVRIGRLAVDRRHQGAGLGAALLVDALRRSFRSPIVVFAAIVDSKDESAALCL